MQSKNARVGILLSVGILFSAIFSSLSGAQETRLPVESQTYIESDLAHRNLDELVVLAWAASSKKQYDQLRVIYDNVIRRFEPEGMAQGANLTAFPPRDRMEDYKVMNQVAVVRFIQAEAFMHQGKNDEAIALFKETIQQYPHSQAWDPSRGSYWSIAEKSQTSIDAMTGVSRADEEALVPATIPQLAFPGTDVIVDYEQYGTFVGEGTREYKFTVNNPNALAAAVGEGIYPNTADVLRDPRYREAYRAGRLRKSHWDMVNSKDLEAAFYKWTVAPEPWGVKLYYIGYILEKAGLYLQAIKAYHALIVQFPDTVAYTYWQTTWFPAQAAVAKIKNIIRMHPELGVVYRYGRIQVLNSFENDPKKYVFVTRPGVIQRMGPASMAEERVMAEKRIAALGAPKRRIGGNKVWFEQYSNGHWRMMADGQPFMIKGFTYTPTKIGQSPDNNTLGNWMTEDSDGNGRIDGPYDAWVDANGNNVQDANEPTVGDFQLMKEMGVNTLRIYHNNIAIQKDVLRELFNNYGIRVIIGDFLGKYTLGSGADWASGTDYENPEHRRNMMQSVEKAVLEYKDEPWLLMWLLGNENNYGVASNADKKPEAFYKFVNEVAKRIKELDPDHPVSISNGDVQFLDKYAKFSPNVDAFGANIYRGDYGFGSYWEEVRHLTDRPAFVTEYGAPAYGKGMSKEEGDAAQAAYHKGCWLDILSNSAGHDDDGEGNAVGGVAFEWLDEWWKNYEPYKHDTKADVVGPFSGGYYFEEWFGIIGQGNGTRSPFLRELRHTYFMYQELWR